MSSLKDGNYTIQNVTFTAHVGETSKPPGETSPSFPLPYRVVLLSQSTSPPKFEVRKWNREGSTRDDVYVISIGDHVTYPTPHDEVLAQQDQIHGWILEQQVDAGPDVYTVGYKLDDKMLFWHLPSGAENTSVQLKTPKPGDSLDGYLFTFDSVLV